MSAHITEQEVTELRDLATRTVEVARRAGADDCEVLIRGGNELTVKVRKGEPELVQEAGSRALGLRVQKGGRRAVTYTSDLRPEALAAFCAETVALAALAEPDEFGAPPDPSELARELPELDLYDPAVAEVDAAWAMRQAIAGEPVDVVFVGSCTNSRLSDLRDAAAVLRGRTIDPRVRMLVVPGSERVKREAEAEGLHEVFRAAGAQWREPGCSMCIGMNGDIARPGELVVSTSNRNFEGRQGKGVRTVLASPATAAASAIAGAIADPRQLPGAQAA